MERRDADGSPRLIPTHGLIWLSANQPAAAERRLHMLTPFITCSDVLLHPATTLFPHNEYVCILTTTDPCLQFSRIWLNLNLEWV